MESLGNRFVSLHPCSDLGRLPSASCGNKAPVGAQALFKGGGEMYITLSDIIQLLSLLCEVVTVLLLALNFFKSNKK